MAVQERQADDRHLQGPQGGISASCDGRTIVDWKGDAGRLSIVGGWKGPNEKHLFLGGWKGGAFRFRKLEVTEVSADGVTAAMTVPGANTPTTGDSP